MEYEKVFVPSAHLLQPQRILYHKALSFAALGPSGKDWNGQVNSECYRPLALEHNIFDSSRGFSIDCYGIVRQEFPDPDVRRKIIEGMRLNGMGDSFIHPILPFLGADDKRILIGAGRHALSKIGIKPKVFWAPESAIDGDTISALEEFDYQAILLAPHQVKRADGGTTDNFPLRLKNGIVAIPFDQELHDRVSFGDISNADTFARQTIVPRIASSVRGFAIAHTDLETYGHHRKGGDHFINYLLKNSLPDQGIRVTSINELLERLRPYERLPLGEIVTNTSWSCPNGLDRWKKACSCTPNGKWKENFLTSFLWLNNEIKTIVGKVLGKKPRSINGYIIENYENLLKNPGGKSSDKDRSLLSARVDALGSLQSCSTFHSDPSVAGWGSIGLGLEAIEHIRDAGLTDTAREMQNGLLNRLREVNVPQGERGLLEVANGILKNLD